MTLVTIPEFCFEYHTTSTTTPLKLPPITTATKKKNINDAKDSLKKFKSNFQKILDEELKNILTKALDEDELEGFGSYEDITNWLVQFQVIMMTHHEGAINGAESLLKKKEKSMLK